METIIQSPFDKKAKAILKQETIEASFRKEIFEITRFYYQCESTQLVFTTSEMDEMAQTQLWNLYREKHQIHRDVSPW